MNKEIIIEKAKQVLVTVLGTAITALGISTLLSPNKIVVGGISGISTIIYQAFGIPLSITIASLNVLFLLAGMWVLGKEFTLKTLLCVGLLSGFVELFSNIPPLTDDLFLATLFGGTIYGFGVAITLVSGASMGGNEILSRIIQHFFPYFPIGRLLLSINLLVILSSLLVFKESEYVMFGILSLFFSSFVVDWLIRKLNVSCIAFVITDKGDDVSKLLVSTSKRGVTSLKAVGAYSDEKKKLLFCALKKNEVPDFQKRVLSVDDGAFIVYSESSEIKGRGFHIYH